MRTEREADEKCSRTMLSQCSDHEFDSAGLVPAEARPPRRFLHRRWTARKFRPARNAPICVFSLQASTRVKFLRWEEFKPIFALRLVPTDSLTSNAIYRTSQRFNHNSATELIIN